MALFLHTSHLTVRSPDIYIAALSIIPKCIPRQETTMSSKLSNLSSHAGCDFVVATTQASINAGLLEYFDDINQPVQYLCFLQDQSGYPTQQIGLDDLLKKTGGLTHFTSLPVSPQRIPSRSS